MLKSSRTSKIEDSIATLKRRLREFGITYYRSESPDDVRGAVQINERVWSYHNRDQVQDMMTILDYQGMQNRRRQALQRRVFFSKGSNWVWSLDRWDKLKEFDIYVYGGIDTFSRRLLWLHAFTSNRDPYIVAKYYFQFVCSEKGNKDRRNHGDDYAFSRSHQYGPSTLNQTIESWWSRQRKLNSQYWMDELKELVEDGLWEKHNVIDKWCLLYTYLPLFERELQELLGDYNSHKIRKQRGKQRPDGVPEDMFHFPEMYGGSEMGYAPLPQDLEEIDRQFNLSEPPKDSNFFAMNGTKGIVPKLALGMLVQFTHV
ncbi:hypothetical protein OS493_014610 [Desmophyllum pertusum]|uniref:Integrase core domain-containing protein n=1 Tax=Desmophyllum pertusum TaxID=174260 RepID=A0A9W9YQ31_9CNID|nr:hypothetical protein OS493_014610 [Desmophyllum pertusum]